MLVVEDDRRLGAVLERLLGSSEIEAVIAPSGKRALELVARSTFDLVLVDLGLPDLDGVDLITQVVARCPRTPVLVLTIVSAEERIFAALRAGACGYLYKEDLGSRLLPAIDEALGGGTPMSPDVTRLLVEHVRRGGASTGQEHDRRADILSERERAVLERFASGERYEDVARALDVSVNTVRSHVRSIYDKLDVCSKTEAVVVATRLGLLAPPRR
jgi:DNA-binding NarL/FixJ family response regulator